MHLHYSMIFMLTPTTNSSRMELGESVIFQPVLQAYPTQHSWIITAHVSLGNLECHRKTFIRQLARIQQLLQSLDQQPSAPTPSYYQHYKWNFQTLRTYTTQAKQP